MMGAVTFNPLQGLHQTSLNIQSLLEDGSKEILKYEHEESEEKILERGNKIF